MTATDLHLTVPYGALERRAEDPEQILIARLQRAEPAAVGEAYDQHHAAVRAFARRLVGDREEAEDLVHETFVTLPRAIQRYRGDANIRTFLISIAVNHAKHFVRAAGRRRAAMERLAKQSEPPPAQSPEQTATNRELARALARALDTLPLDQRIAFVLCEVEERSSREVAATVRAPEATIRTRLFHARKKLRAALEKEGYR
jgi:RNA polymerase sigma-70 factor (ECF subfamily)